jgi:hypothetical protein
MEAIDRKKTYLFLSLGFSCLLLQGFFLFAGLHNKSYDAYVHMFFASHYAKHWFENWNLQWYTGFNVFLYPPLAHQCIGFLIPLLRSVEASYAFWQWVVLWVFALGVYRFGRIWLSQEEAVLAALIGVFSTSVFQTVYEYGQFPTLFALAILLNALPFIRGWVQAGSLRGLVLGGFLMLVVLTSHHLTFFLGLFFFLLPVLLHEKETLQNFRDVKFIFRTGLFLFLIFGIGFILLQPFFSALHSFSCEQKPIYHASRNNYFASIIAFINFFALPNIFWLPFIAAVLWKGWREPGMRVLFLSWFALFILGLGGTTPIPKWILGKLYDIITLDRFCLWATVVILPILSRLIHKNGSKFILAGYLVFLAGLQLMMFVLVTKVKFQPDPLPMKPMVEFLEADEAKQYRYLTLGMGCQMARLGYLSDAQNVDGAYHTARPLPELRESGIELLDGAKYFEEIGLRTLKKFIGNPEKFHLKYVFVNDPSYNRFLDEHGWKELTQLSNGVVVWSHDDISPLRPEEMKLPKKTAPWMNLLWASYPLLILFFITLWIYFDVL